MSELTEVISINSHKTTPTPTKKNDENHNNNNNTNNNTNVSHRHNDNEDRLPANRITRAENIDNRNYNYNYNKNMKFVSQARPQPHGNPYAFNRINNISYDKNTYTNYNAHDQSGIIKTSSTSLLDVGDMNISNINPIPTANRSITPITPITPIRKQINNISKQPKQSIIQHPPNNHPQTQRKINQDLDSQDYKNNIRINTSSPWNINTFENGINRNHHHQHQHQQHYQHARVRRHDIKNIVTNGDHDSNFEEESKINVHMNDYNYVNDPGRYGYSRRGSRAWSIDKVASCSRINTRTSRDIRVIRKPHIIIIGNENYDVAWRLNTGWKNLNGVTSDVYLKLELWYKIYGYNNISVIFSPRDHTNNESEKRKKELCDIFNYPREFFDKNFKGVEILNNSNNFQEKLQRIVDKIENNKDCDSLIIDYSGHGMNRCLILGNGKEYPISNIEDMFYGENCQQLIDKPKIMIFDCCCGVKYAQMIESRIGINGMRNGNTRGQDRNSYYGSNVNYNYSRVETNLNFNESRLDISLDRLYHPYSGFAFLFSNHSKYTINDDSNGGHLTRAIFKVLANLQRKDMGNCNVNCNNSLRNMVVDIRKQAIKNAGKGDEKTQKSAQLVIFQEALQYFVYFQANK